MVHTKVEDYEEEKFYFHKIPAGFPFVDLQEYEDSVPIVNNVRKNYKFFTRAEIERSDAVYKTFGNLGNPTVDDFEEILRANHIQDCPMTSKYINNSKVICGPHAEIFISVITRTFEIIDKLFNKHTFLCLLFYFQSLYISVFSWGLYEK